MHCETIFMFSGQGSQYFHMGKSLYEGNDTFRNCMVRLDGVVRDLSGRSVIETIYSPQHGKGEPFDRIVQTNPAIFMVEYSLAETLMHAGVRPDMVLAVSLGSLAAATVAGFLDVEDAICAVVKQAAVFEECSEPGGMIAVMADPALFSDEIFKGRADLAAINFSSHFVVSAKAAALPGIETALRRRSVNYQRLPVCFPFHSQWIDKVKTAFESLMRSIPTRRGRLPLICCAQAATLEDLPDDFFWRVVRHPIRFWETTTQLESQGARRYIDAGPAGTLATFLKYSFPVMTSSSVHTVLTPFGFDQENLAALLTSTRN